MGPPGRTWEGVGAVEALVRLLPGWRWAAWLFRIPAARPLARLAYRWIARERYLLGCDDHRGSGRG